LDERINLCSFVDHYEKANGPIEIQSKSKLFTICNDTLHDTLYNSTLKVDMKSEYRSLYVRLYVLLVNARRRLHSGYGLDIKDLQECELALRDDLIRLMKFSLMAKSNPLMHNRKCRTKFLMLTSLTCEHFMNYLSTKFYTMAYGKETVLNSKIKETVGELLIKIGLKHRFINKEYYNFYTDKTLHVIFITKKGEKQYSINKPFLQLYGPSKFVAELDVRNKISKRRFIQDYYYLPSPNEIINPYNLSKIVKSFTFFQENSRNDVDGKILEQVYGHKIVDRSFAHIILRGQQSAMGRYMTPESFSNKYALDIFNELNVSLISPDFPGRIDLFFAVDTSQFGLDKLQASKRQSQPMKKVSDSLRLIDSKWNQKVDGIRGHLSDTVRSFYFSRNSYKEWYSGKKSAAVDQAVDAYFNLIIEHNEKVQELGKYYTDFLSKFNIYINYNHFISKEEIKEYFIERCRLGH
jgi:hypothetical protein